jgi:hypothetical protein
MLTSSPALFNLRRERGGDEDEQVSNVVREASNRSLDCASVDDHQCYWRFNRGRRSDYLSELRRCDSSSVGDVMVPTLFDMLFPILLIQLAYLTGYVASVHVRAKADSGESFCLWYYTFGYALIVLGLSVLAFLNVFGAF